MICVLTKKFKMPGGDKFPKSINQTVRNCEEFGMASWYGDGPHLVENRSDFPVSVVDKDGKCVRVVPSDQTVEIVSYKQLYAVPRHPVLVKPEDTLSLSIRHAPGGRNLLGPNPRRIYKDKVADPKKKKAPKGKKKAPKKKKKTHKKAAKHTKKKPSLIQVVEEASKKKKAPKKKKKKAHKKAAAHPKKKKAHPKKKKTTKTHKKKKAPSKKKQGKPSFRACCLPK